MHSLAQENSWWGHEVRDDLRKMTTESETLKRRSFHGTEGGMDHAATAELYREVVLKKGKARKATQLEEGNAA